MAPKYELYSGFTVNDALAKAGAPHYQGQFQLGEPPVNFFTHPPADATAVFSTICGSRPFRMVQDPTFEREGYYWWAAEIQRVCDELRRNLPLVCGDVETPQDYWDLYKYFDAYDIYYRGAQNLWNVINTLVFENQYATTIVDGEQKAQANQRISLFESLVVEVLKAPEMRTKLLSWNKEAQQDILRVFTPYELHVFFKGYEHYHQHYLNAIRTIFEKHYEALRQGFSFDAYTWKLQQPGPYFPQPIMETSGDPFMEKFDIPNRIMNGIVIVDGTSQTAARKAKQDAHVSMNSSVQYNNTNTLPQQVAAAGASPCSNAGSSSLPGDHNAMIVRCSSAPSIGGDPASIGKPSTDEARVYPGDVHEVDKRLMGCQKPGSPIDGSGNAPHVAKGFQVAMPTSEINSQQFPSTMNHALPIVGDGRSASSSAWQPALPLASNPAPGIMPPTRLPGLRGRGISQGPFSQQIPRYVLAQQHKQGLPPPPPPSMTQQMQCAAPAYIRVNGGGNATNMAGPQFQPQGGPQYSVGGPMASRQHKNSSGSANHSSGSWQPVGSDEIHGPKVIFRKDSVYDRANRNSGAGRWQGNGISNINSRRVSAASMSGGYQQFGINRPQNHDNHTGLRQAGVATTAMRSNSYTPAMDQFICVNVGKFANQHTKFEPCFCPRCDERNRSIYISGFVDYDRTVTVLKQHFSQFGQIEGVIPGRRPEPPHFSTARIR
ncbi:hypothetical protein GGS21DRAFT_521614 [Xylaria nigripes]|nr:hypothetical protein GGS21DRAFT_521614 [Xylaria nigripes]